MKKSLFTAIGAMLGIMGFASAAAALPTARIIDFGYSGTGCPAGTVDVSITPEGDRVFAGFDAYIAETGSAGTRIARTNCQLRVGIKFDPGWSFSVATVDYRGFAGLPQGSYGENVSAYFFAGQPPMGDARAITRLTGPFFDNYDRRDEVGLLVWSPCGSAQHDLVINNEVRVIGRDTLMTVDSITTQVQMVFGLSWKKC
jgi:hypothetical protein